MDCSTPDRHSARLTIKYQRKDVQFDVSPTLNIHQSTSNFISASLILFDINIYNYNGSTLHYYCTHGPIHRILQYNSDHVTFRVNLSEWQMKCTAATASLAAVFNLALVHTFFQNKY